MGWAKTHLLYSIKLKYMKKLIYLVIVLFSLTSCGTYVRVGKGGCGAFAPKRFENDKRLKARMNWINNPKSGRYRTF
jgi:hypothetical protein